MKRRLLFSALFCLVACTRVVTQLEPAKPPVPDTATSSRSTVGNGSDYFSPDHDSAWFLGEKPIEYCIVASSADRVGFAHQAIEVAFERWQNYLRKYRVNDPNFHPERDIKPGDPTLLMNAHYRPTCDDQAELKIYFGVEDAEVKNSLTNYLRPYGISERTAYDAATGRGKGFIWIAEDKRYGDLRPDWGFDQLTSILLHELGHVAGCGHVRNTVMDENLAELINFYLLSYQRIGNYGAWERIDYWGEDHQGWHQLLSCPACDYSHSEHYTRAAPALGAILFGDGEIEAVRLPAKPVGIASLDFQVWREGSWRTVTIGGLHQVAEVGTDAPVFRIVFQRDGKLVSSVSRSSGFVYYGTTEQGVPLLLEWNTDGQSFAISHIDRYGVRRRLFELENGADEQRHFGVTNRKPGL